MANGSRHIRFRPLAEEDLPLLHCWLNTPHVLEWWDRPGATLDDVSAKYRPLVHGHGDVAPYAIMDGELPIGYVQTYPVQDTAWGLQIPSPAVGLDLFIGDVRYVHRGLGPRIMRQFLNDIVFRDGTVAACFVDPDARNRIAIRAFEKAGFRQVAGGPGPAGGACLILMVREDQLKEPEDSTSDCGQ